MLTRTVRIWDLPVRLTHWGFALIIPAMWYTGENGEWSWHFRLGLLLLGLLVFRIIWGFLGTETARFASFVKGPKAVLRYLGGNHEDSVTKGHNPLGALSVLALLAAMLVQVGLGLFSGDPYDGATGPLNALVGVMTADTITELHEVFFYVVVALIAVHLAAIAFYTVVKQQKLVGAMVTGAGEKAPGVPDNTPAPWGRALVSMVIALAVVAWVWAGAPPLS